MSTLTIPNTFTTGEVIDASEQNANFTAIKNFAEALSAGTNIDSGAIGTSALANSAVTAAKIATNTITTTQLATALQQLLVPAGTITATIRSTADAGYLLLNGATVASADTLYPSLWAVLPSSWKSGTSLVLPNMANKLIGGAGAITLGALGGDNTILEANLPSHAHTLASHTHTLTHDHAVDPPSTPVSVTVNDNTVDRVTRLTSQVANGFTTGVNPAVLGTGLQAGNAGFGLSNAYVGMAVDYEEGHGHTGSGTVDIASFTSGAASTTTTSGPNVTNTGNTGGGTDLTVEQLAVNFQIKAH
jgi:hypothetical protein